MKNSRIRSCLPSLLSTLLLGAGGCATRGPNHVYLVRAAAEAVEDVGPAGHDLAHAVHDGESATGLAYDFNTDHLFLRIAPAQVIRVIERPSGKVLREMPLGDDCKSTAGRDGRFAPADLAIRSSDRHLFAVGADGRSVVELTLYGGFVRRLAVTGCEDAIRGLAYDQRDGRLLVLGLQQGVPRVGALGPDGHVTYYVTFAIPVSAVSLGYDSDARHLFVPLADGTTLGEFDETGALVRSIPGVPGAAITAVDAGPRSFVRVF
ncbi:MAG TPA: hypothetical protein VHD61_03445 [Lacunisphaera sp.]|nr:hypothetical protein [Lacunisphaera sp.]